MFHIFREELLITIVMISLLCAGILTRILLALIYQKMIKEADNMAATSNQLLKQCKLKFANCYQLNNGVANIPVFVDKFLNRMSLGIFSFETLYHLTNQMVLLSVVTAGIGVCKSIIGGRALMEILPFYIAAFAGLYLYFSVAAAADIKGKRRILKVNLVDYLENHLSARMQVTEQDLGMLYGKRTVELMPLGGRSREAAQDVRGDDHSIRGAKKGNAAMQNADGRTRAEARGIDGRNDTAGQNSNVEILQDGSDMATTKILPVEELDDLLKEFLTV